MSMSSKNKKTSNNKSNSSNSSSSSSSISSSSSKKKPSDGGNLVSDLMQIGVEVKDSMLNNGKEYFADARQCLAGSCIRKAHDSGVQKVADNIEDVGYWFHKAIFVQQITTKPLTNHDDFNDWKEKLTEVQKANYLPGFFSIIDGRHR